MAHHKSAKKRIRRNQRRTVVNRMRVSRIRTLVKAVEKAISGGDREVAANAFKQAQPELHRGAMRGVMHRNTVARKLSRLSSRIKAMS